MENKSKYGTTFTGIREILLHYDIKGYAIREGVTQLRRVMREHRMQFPFSTMNNRINGIWWNANNYRPDPIEISLNVSKMERLRNIPKGQTPETYPFFVYMLSSFRSGGPQNPFDLFSGHPSDEEKINMVMEGIQGKTMLFSHDFDDTYFDPYKDIWSGTHSSSLYRVFQPAYHGLHIVRNQSHWDHLRDKRPLDFSKYPLKKCLFPDGLTVIKDSIQYVVPDVKSYDGAKFKDWDALEAIQHNTERGIRIQSRRYGMHAFFLKRYAQSLISDQDTFKTLAKKAVPRSYTTTVPTIADIEKANQPFYKNIKTKGGKKNKKNWR